MKNFLLKIRRKKQRQLQKYYVFGVIDQEEGCLEKKIWSFGQMICIFVFGIFDWKKVDFWSVIEERCDNQFVN